MSLPILYECPESDNLRRFHGFTDDSGNDARPLRFLEDDCREYIEGGLCSASCNHPFLYDWHHSVLQHIAEQFGWMARSETECTEDGIYHTVRTVTTKGLFASPDRTAAVWHFALPDTILGAGIAALRDCALPIEHIYKGDKYLLLRTAEQVAAFNIDYFRTLERVVQTLQDAIPGQPLRQTATFGVTGPTIFFHGGWFLAALRGLSGVGYDEQERAILSDRLSSSQFFFHFKAPIDVDWSLFAKPQDDNFQELCRLLLERQPSVKRVVSIGKTRAADRGRDLEAHELLEGLFPTKPQKWLVQCKFTTKSLGPSSISGWTDRVREHGYDGFWLMTNNDVTPDLFDQLKDTEKNAGIRTRLWQRGDFHRQLNVFSEILSDSRFFVAKKVGRP